MIGLTDEELEKLWLEDSRDWGKNVSKAQLKKVGEWGDSFCNIMGHNNPGEVVFKHGCPDCWQALLEEVKDSGDNGD